MISDDQFTRIRRLFYAEHWKVGTIAAELGVHDDVVLRAIGASAFNQRKARPAPPSLLDPFKDLLVETLKQHPRLRATRLHQMARERGYAGSVSIVRRYVATVRPTPVREAFLRRSTLPAEEAQVDWAHFGKVRVGHADRALVCFVMVLGYSRGLYAQFFHDQSTTNFLAGHVAAFGALGGVPRRILYDNLKSAVLERIGDNIRFHEDLLAMAAHYHFEPRPCAPYRGNEKGKVERSIRYLRDSFFPARKYSDLADLNRQLANWITGVAHVRAAPGDGKGRPVSVVLDEERPLLLPLPATPFPAAQPLRLLSGKTPYLRIDRNDYSIPHTLVGRPLTVRLSNDRVRIFNDEGELVADHARSFDSGALIETPAHLAALRAYKHHARELRGRDELTRQCPSAQRLLIALAERNAPLQSEVRSLLLLCERYGAAAVERALAQSLDKGLASAHAVEKILDEDRHEQGLSPRAPSSAPMGPRLSPTDLAAYDRIGHKQKKDDSDK